MPTARFQPSFAGGVLGPGLHGRIDQSKYDAGLKVGFNTFVHAHGGVSNRAGFKFCDEVMDHTVVHRLIPFERDDDENYVLVLGDEEMKVMQDGAFLETSPGVDYNPATPFTEAMLPDLDYVQSIDVMFFAHPDVFPQKMSRTGATAYSFAGIEINPPYDTDDWLDTSGGGAIVTGFAIAPTRVSSQVKDWSYVITVEYSGGESEATAPITVSNASTLDGSNFNVLTWDAMASAVQYHVYRKDGVEFKRIKTITAGTETYSDTGVDAPTSTTPPTLITVTPSAAGSVTFRYKVSAIIDGVETFPAIQGITTTGSDLSVAGRSNTVSWTGTGDAQSYNVYRERNGIFGYVGFTEDESFVDDNISADLTLTPTQASTFFGTSTDYPGAVSIYQQRLVYGGSTAQPETIWMSRTGDFENFTRSRVLRDDDRVELDITGRNINRIRNLAQLRELLVFTSNGEFSVTGPDGVMLATNPIQTQYGYAGGARVRPLVIEDTMLFVDRTGRQVRDLRYAFEQDGYTGNDLTIWADHFFDGRQIVDWAYCRNPYSVVWVCLDNGKLLSMTYKREHQVWAWCEHDTGGEVESLCAIRGSTEDTLYAIIKRTVNSTTKRYVECMATREFEGDVTDFFGVDSGITYDGVATTTITGLSHLEGETVVALADGSVIENLTVSSGQVTLAVAAEKVHIGLSYYSEIETLPPPINLQDVGAARGRPIKASQAFIQLEDTRGIKVGPTRDLLADLVLPVDDLAEIVPVYTGMQKITLFPDWNVDGNIVVRQDYPLPMTILGISPEYSVGRT